MIETLPPMAPGEVLDYRIDAAGLLEDGETLTEVGSSIVVAGATNDSQSFASDGVTVWISGAAAGTPIRVTATLRTSAGRTFRRIYVIPFGEPVSLELTKSHLRILDDDSEDELIAGYITAARKWVENYTGHILVQRSVIEHHPAFGRFFDLRWRPFDPATAEIGYIDADGADQSVSDLIASGSRVYPAFNTWWPATRLNTGITVTYTAGYASGEEPEELIQAILLLVGHWYLNREAVGQAMSEAPLAVTSLCDQYRVLTL